MDTSQWAQGIGVVKEMENPCSKQAPMLERRTRPQKDQALNCPRCNSTNTKFCYYNNYSLSQPRYFCKTCRRYWTEGGSLRNVPVGGGSRKNKRSTPSSPSPSSSQQIPSSTITKNIILNNHDLASHNNNTNFPHSASQNPKIHQGQDLNLAYPPPQEDYNTLSKFIELPYEQDKPTTTNTNNNNNNSSSSPSSHLSAMELLKTGIVNSSSSTSSRGLNSTNFIMPMSISESSAAAAMYNSTGFANLQDFKPGLNFSVVEGFENGYGGLQGIEGSGSGARMLFPVEEMKQQVPSSDHEFDEQNNINTRNQGDSTGFWNGMLGGGPW